MKWFLLVGSWNESFPVDGIIQSQVVHWFSFFGPLGSPGSGAPLLVWLKLSVHGACAVARQIPVYPKWSHLQNKFLSRHLMLHYQLHSENSQAYQTPYTHQNTTFARLLPCDIVLAMKFVLRNYISRLLRASLLSSFCI